jgi:hypothetical protein
MVIKAVDVESSAVTYWAYILVNYMNRWDLIDAMAADAEIFKCNNSMINAEKTQANIPSFLLSSIGSAITIVIYCPWPLLESWSNIRSRMDLHVNTLDATSLYESAEKDQENTEIYRLGYLDYEVTFNFFFLNPNPK